MPSHCGYFTTVFDIIVAVLASFQDQNCDHVWNTYYFCSVIFFSMVALDSFASNAPSGFKKKNILSILLKMISWKKKKTCHRWLEIKSLCFYLNLLCCAVSCLLMVHSTKLTCLFLSLTAGQLSSKVKLFWPCEQRFVRHPFLLVLYIGAEPLLLMKFMCSFLNIFNRGKRPKKWLECVAVIVILLVCVVKFLSWLLWFLLFCLHAWWRNSVSLSNSSCICWDKVEGHCVRRGVWLCELNNHCG